MTDGPYRLVLAPGARRALTDDLPESVAVAAWEFMTGALVTSPQQVGIRLKPPFDGQRRARRGEYRIRYRIDEEGRTIRVLAVDHRRDAYRS